MEIKHLNEPPVSGFLHTPDTPHRDGIVLTHGAGANCQTALLVNLANALAGLGWAVLRYDLPFRQKRKFGPPHPSQAAADREGLRTALRELRSRVPGTIYLGGHSYGGRQASILASEDPAEVHGLLLLSYPLHPPKKPEQLRTGHFSQIVAPCLFIHGSSDPFGSPEELRNALTLIPARTGLLTISGFGHDLGKGQPDHVSEWAKEFIVLISV